MHTGIIFVGITIKNMAKKEKPKETPKKGVLREGPLRKPAMPDGMKQITKWK